MNACQTQLFRLPVEAHMHVVAVRGVGEVLSAADVQVVGAAYLVGAGAGRDLHHLAHKPGRPGIDDKPAVDAPDVVGEPVGMVAAPVGAEDLQGGPRSAR
jgi:hypothetical protein